VVHADEVQGAVDDRLAQVGGVRRADDDVAQLAGAGRLAGLVDRERQDVGRSVLAAVLTVEVVDALLVDEFDREMTLADPRCFERCGCRAFEARFVCLDLDQRDARRRSSEVCRVECSS
jgi:hypothetical protein